MAASFLHGVETIDTKVGVRPVRETRSAVIGLVGTASVGDINKLTICTSSADDAQFGQVDGKHSIPSALKTLREQGAGVVVVVNVGEDNDATPIVESDIIGKTNADNSRTGIQCFKLGYGTYGFDVKILIAPYFSDKPAVAAALLSMAYKCRGMAYVDLPEGVLPMEAIASRGGVAPANGSDVYQTQSSRVRFCYPHRKTFDTHSNSVVLEPLSIVWAGIRAMVDRKIGYWSSSSNKEMRGTLGLEQTLTARVDDADTEANMLNEAGFSTAFKDFGNGYLTWGNRSAAYPTSTAYENFEQVQRTKDMIEVSLHQSSLQFIDSDIRQPQIEAITEFCHEYMRSLVMRGAIVGGEAFFDPSRNPVVQIANGQLRFGYKFTPIFPTERITYDREVTGEYLLDLKAVGFSA